MNTQMAFSRLLGFRDFFGRAPKDKVDYGLLVGRDMIETFCCMFLGYFRNDSSVPSVIEFFQQAFTLPNSKPYTQQRAYQDLEKRFRRLTQTELGDRFGILSIESLLNMFIWAQKEPLLGVATAAVDASRMHWMIELMLIFNDEVLANYQKAVDSAKKIKDNQQEQRLVLANSYPQSDLVNADYAQLIFTQGYKLLRLLDFMEHTPPYDALANALYTEFGCVDRKAFVQSLFSAVIIPMKGLPGLNVLHVPIGLSEVQSRNFLSTLTVDPLILTDEQDDFLPLRNTPLQRLSQTDFRVVYDLFLIKKLFNGVVFKLKELGRTTGIKPSFSSDIKKDFSEEVIVYDVLDTVYDNPATCKRHGDDIKLPREPDYYARLDLDLMLYESKDFFLPGGDKLSYDFAVLEAGFFVPGRVQKAIDQLLHNIKRAILGEFVFDNAIDPKTLSIFSVLLVHDSVHSAAGFNYWVNVWFGEKLETLKKDAAIVKSCFDFAKVMPITVVEIDSLILYKEHFRSGRLKMADMLREFHSFVNYSSAAKGVTEKNLATFGLPFSKFVRSKCIELKLQPHFEEVFGYLRTAGVAR